MTKQPLDYHSPSAERRLSWRLNAACIIVAVAVLLANGALLAMAASDRSWGALGIAIMFGPITNGILLLLSLACTPVVKASAIGTSIGPYLATAICLPLAAIPIDFFIIKSMGLH